ncbi:hypothetical protein NLU13_1501 [Sarocladium strictum]|uniref:6-phosphogluconolactonase n=1 Tax=Sarocladium strictum TaxID=5046 RepID=A0AA39GR34_SARSR|nr:hypothetical protein NLU13_1501 [Sarocladium strictum]
MAVLSKTFALGAALLMQLAAAQQLVVSHFSGTVYALNYSDGNLTITDQNKQAGQRIPSWVTWDGKSRTAYVSDESWFGARTGRFASYGLSEAGKLTVSGVATTNGGDVASGVYGGPGGNSFIGQAAYEAGTLTTWALPLESSDTPIQSFQYFMNAPGPNPERQNKPHLHSVFTDPTGDFLLSNDLGADITRVWSIASDTGRLTECPGIRAHTGGDGPRHSVFREADGVTYLYVINELGETVSGYVVTYPSSGCLSAQHFQSISTFPENSTKPANTKAAEVHIKGNFLYASNRNDETFGKERDSIAQYSIGADGRLRFLGLANAQGFFPRTYSISEDGTLVAIGGQTDAVVSIVERDTETGLIGDLLARINVGQRGTYMGEDGLSAVTWAE